MTTLSLSPKIFNKDYGLCEKNAQEACKKKEKTGRRKKRRE
jgi:hypothetical protein